jgi:hypothetical protein
MEKLCAGALVIFEHRRSRDRALRDYDLYSNHLLPFVSPPPPLLFRGRHRLVVTEAPPPSDVIFENWETPAFSRAARRVVTTLGTLLMLCVALFIVVTLRAVSNDVAAGANFDAGLCGVLGDQVYQVGRGAPWLVHTVHCGVAQSPTPPHPTSPHPTQPNPTQPHNTSHHTGRCPRAPRTGPLDPLPTQQPRGCLALPRRAPLPLLLPA